MIIQLSGEIYVYVYVYAINHTHILLYGYVCVCLQTVVLEKTVESPLDNKDIKPINPKKNQPWLFIDAEAEAPILWPPDVKNRLTRKDLDYGEDWGQEEKGTTEDKMVGWNYQLNGHEFEQALGDGEGQGSLACCRPWNCRDSYMTDRLNNSDMLLSLIWCAGHNFTNKAY